MCRFSSHHYRLCYSANIYGMMMHTEAFVWKSHTCRHSSCFVWSCINAWWTSGWEFEEGCQSCRYFFAMGSSGLSLCIVCDSLLGVNIYSTIVIGIMIATLVNWAIGRVTLIQITNTYVYFTSSSSTIFSIHKNSQLRHRPRLMYVQLST
jgi:hypothetical protein